MSMIGYQFEKMVVSPIKDAKLYYGLMGEVFYRNIESTNSGLFTSYTKTGDTIRVHKSTHIVAGRLVEITEEMDFYVPHGKTLAFRINLVPQNVSNGFPNTPEYTVTNNQLSLVVLPEYVSQLRYNEYKDEYTNDQDIQVITVPILNPSLVFDIETPTGTTHTITSAFDSYKYSAHSEIAFQVSNTTSVMNSNALSTLNATNSVAAASMNSAFQSQTNKVSSQFSSLSNSNASAFSSQSSVLSLQNSSQFTSLQNSASSSLSNFSSSVASNLNSNGREIFESVADIYVDPYISNHVSNYIESNGISSGDKLGFLAEDLAYTDKDGNTLVGYSEIECIESHYDYDTWQLVATYNVKINNSDEIITTTQNLKFGSAGEFDPIYADVNGNHTVVGYTNVKVYPSGVEDINAALSGINAKNLGDVTTNNLISKTITTVEGITVSGDIMTSYNGFATGWQADGEFGQLQVKPLGFDAGGLMFVMVRITNVNTIIEKTTTKRWVRMNINKSLPKNFHVTMSFPCWINSNISVKSITVMSTDTANREQPDMYLSWEDGVLNKQGYNNGQGVSTGQLQTFEAFGTMHPDDFADLLKVNI